MPSLDVVIVNWNAGRQLRECLESLVGACRPEVFTLSRVVVVDNASTDGSAEGVGDLALPLVLLRNDENRGFAAACNQGAEESRADVLLFLNPDTRLFADSLAAPISLLERPEHRRTGIMGIQLVDEEGRVQRTCSRFPEPGHTLARMAGLDRLLPARVPGHFMTEWPHTDSREVDQVMGAFFLTRRALFEALGGFDERFFVYFEELDYSVRARAAGWRTFFLADARAYHYGGGTSEQVKARRLFYYLRSRALYFCKHFGPRAAAGHLAAALTLELAARTGLALLRRSPAAVTETLGGYRLLVSDLPAIRRTCRS